MLVGPSAEDNDIHHEYCKNLKFYWILTLNKQVTAMSGCKEFDKLKVINGFKSVTLKAICRYPEHKLAKFEYFRFMFFTTHYLGDQIKKDDMDGTCGTHRRYHM